MFLFSTLSVNYYHFITHLIFITHTLLNLDFIKNEKKNKNKKIAIQTKQKVFA